MQTADILHKNLAALPPTSAPLRDLLLAHPLPAAWIPAIGTDSTPTFTRIHPDRIQWLGNTSMPAASAAPLTASMIPGQTNGLGLSIGSGFEWLHLLTKLQSHQALFILEPGLTAARLALSICDLSASLANCKIILLLGPDPQSQLAAWLAQFPGLDPPAVMHPLPTLAQDRRHALLTAGEAAVRAAVIARAQQIESASAALHHLQPIPNSSIAMLLKPRHQWERPSAAQASRLCSATLQLDHHLHGGRLARINLCLQEKPATIISDLFRHQLQIPLPQQIAIETHLPPFPSIAFWQAENLTTICANLAPQDRLTVCATAHKHLLTRAGFPESQIQVAPLWSNESDNLADSPIPPFSHSAPLPTVILAADLPSTDPAVYGFTLPSHVTLWQAAIDLITDDPLAIHWDMTADLFRRAQQRVSIQVTDPALAASLQLGIRHVLMEALLLITLARQLHVAGISLLLMGDGWQQANLTGNVTLLPFPEIESEIASPIHPFPLSTHQSSLYLHISPSGIVPPSLLAAITAGIPIAAATHPLDTRPGGICTLLEDQTQFLRLTRQNWMTQLRSLLVDAPRRHKFASSTLQKFRVQASG